MWRNQPIEYLIRIRDADIIAVRILCESADPGGIDRGSILIDALGVPRVIVLAAANLFPDSVSGSQFDSRIVSIPRKQIIVDVYPVQ